MSNEKAKNILKILTINIVVLLSIFFILEISFRLAYPEFVGDIHGAEVSWGQRNLYVDSLGEFKGGGNRFRIPFHGYELNENDALILLLGDSITRGYGSSYEDIYWNVFQRMINTSKVDSIQILPLSGYGNDLQDSKNALGDVLADSDREIRMIIYQFNFNDIIPYGQKKVKNLVRGSKDTTLWKKLSEFRYEHMNKSVFMRVIQHYAGTFRRNRFGTCEERAFDALGSYTWTFGGAPFKTKSEALWRKFHNDLASMKELSDSMGARFVVLISPILFDIDKDGHHPYYNYLNYDFDCATIEPRERLKSITDRLAIDTVDPSDYVRKHFENRIREGNFSPYYFTADENHFTPTASTYIAEYLFAYYVNIFRDGHKIPGQSGQQYFGPAPAPSR